MGKGGSVGASDSVTSGLQGDADALTKIAQTQANQSAQIFQSSLPGFEKSLSFYNSLASGDPFQIARATAPIAASADTAAAAAKANILNTGPAGGEKTLALEQVDVNRGKQVGDAATSSFLGSFNALSSLAGQGIGESQSAAGLGISGYGSGASTLSNLGGLQLQGQQLQAEQKGNSLGALSSLGGDAATLGAGALAGKGGADAATAALAFV